MPVAWGAVYRPSLIVPPDAPSTTDQVTPKTNEPFSVATNTCDPPSGTLAEDGEMAKDVESAGPEGGAADEAGATDEEGAAGLPPPPHAVSSDGAIREIPATRLKMLRCSCACALITRPPA